MKKIVACGIKADSNFGGPSILHGIEQLLMLVVSEPFEILNYQKTPVIPSSIEDLGFKTEQEAVHWAKFLVYGVLYKYGITSKNKTLNKQLKSIKEADYIIDLYGICFCDNFNVEKYNCLINLALVLRKFTIPVIGKLFKVKTIKNISSFGPMEKRNSITQARIAEKVAIDVFIAREKASQDMMKSIAKIKKPVYLAPDIANLMPFSKTNNSESIGISISHQIVRQWESEESYLSCIKNLCAHIINEHKMKIVLIPNELNSSQFDDIDVAQDIINLLNENEKKEITLVDVSNMNSSQLKNIIVSCEAVIASRYHTCVAALSGGVPLLVVGWHHKYQELLAYYGQSDWILTSKECCSISLIKKFDDLFSNRNEIQQTINQAQKTVKDLIVSTYQKILE